MLFLDSIEIYDIEVSEFECKKFFFSSFYKILLNFILCKRDSKVCGIKSPNKVLYFLCKDFKPSQGKVRFSFGLK